MHNFVRFLGKDELFDEDKIRLTLVKFHGVEVFSVADYFPLSEVEEEKLTQAKEKGRLDISYVFKAKALHLEKFLIVKRFLFGETVC